MSFKETVKAYVGKVVEVFKKIGSWISSHNYVRILITCVLSGIGGFIAANVLHNGKSVSSVGEGVQSARKSAESAIDANRRTESNIDELKSTVGTGKSILEEIGKQKLDR